MKETTLIPCVLQVLNVHIESEGGDFKDSSSLGTVRKSVGGNTVSDQDRDGDQCPGGVSRMAKRAKYPSLVIDMCKKLLK